MCVWAGTLTVMTGRHGNLGRYLLLIMQAADRKENVVEEEEWEEWEEEGGCEGGGGRTEEAEVEFRLAWAELCRQEVKADWM